MAAGLVSSETSFSGLQMSFSRCISHCFFSARTEREYLFLLQGHRFCWNRAPPLWSRLTLITSFRALSPNIVALRVRASAYERETCAVQSTTPVLKVTVGGHYSAYTVWPSVLKGSHASHIHSTFSPSWSPEVLSYCSINSESKISSAQKSHHRSHQNDLW